MDIDLEVLPVPRGRPSRYNKALCVRVLELGAAGLCKAEIAAEIKVSVKTINAWIKAHGEFRTAMSHAKDLEYAWWLRMGRRGQVLSTWKACGWALQMRNRFGKCFRERLPAKAKPRGESVNAEELRAEMERKLSRIADAGGEDIVSEPTDTAGVEKPQI